MSAGARASLAPLLALVLAACGAAPDAVPPPTEVEVEEVVLSLLTRDEVWTPLDHPEDAAPFAQLLAPLGKTRLDGGALPALVVRPPTEVAFAIPPGAGPATLHVATAVDASAYRGPAGEVRFTVALDGAVVHDGSRPFGESVQRATRVWERFAFPVTGGERLTVRAESDRPLPRAARVGFGLLELTRPTTVPRTSASAERPNVLLVVVDTLRADRLGCYGYEPDVSPRVDAFAETGVLFERTYAPSSWTWPSTASLLTGTPPPEHGVVGDRSCYLPEELDSLAELFLRAGARTGAFTCNPFVSADKNFDQGFEDFATEFWRAPEVVPLAIDWIDRAPDERFFLYLHLFDPHLPYAPDADFAERFGGGFEPADQERVEQLWRTWNATGRGADQLAEFVELARGLYDAEVATMDRALGQLFDALEERDLRETTLVVVTSDHGEEFLEHGKFGHRDQLFRETVEVPLILAGPGLPQGLRVSHPVELRGLGGTLLRRANIAPTPRLDGPDLFATEPHDGPIFFSTGPGHWKVGPASGQRVDAIHGCLDGELWFLWAPEAGTSLYDLTADPLALEDLAAERAADVERLRAATRAWLEAGTARRAGAVDGGEATRELLRALGYR